MSHQPVPQLQALDRSRAPEPGPPQPFRFPPYRRASLLPGLELMTAPDPESPLLCLHLLFEAGAEHEGTPGLASLTASLLDEGTGRHDALELAARVERLGAALTVDASWDSSAATLLCRREHLAQGLELLAELASEASFPEEELERCRRQRLTELLRRRDSPAITADLTLLGQLYGTAPYGRSILGTEESISTLNRADLARYYLECYQGRPRILVAVGGFEEKALEAAVRAGWSGAAGAPANGDADPAALAARLAPAAPARRRVVVVDRRGAPQTEIRVGQVSLERGHPDHRVFRVASTLLGGKYTSRLNRNLRERNGFTYGISASLASRRGPAPFVIGTAVANAVVGAATVEIFAELERLRHELVPAEELAETAQYLVGTFPFTLQGVQERAGRLEDIAVHGLAEDHYDRWLAGVAATTPEELGRVVRRHLEPEAQSVVAVGPAAELVPQLERWGEVEVLSAG